MEPDVTNVRSAYWHTEGLNGAIQIHVIKRILIVPDSCRRVRYFITHKPNPIVTWIALDMVYCCTSSRPSDDRRLHTHGRSSCRKGEKRGPAAHRELTIGGIVIHVALPWVGLTPSVFSRTYVLSFGKISRALILRRDEIARCHRDPVRRASVVVARVIVRIRWEGTCEGVRPRARTDAVLVIV